MTDARHVVRSLTTFNGSYRGNGVNHEEEAFTGTLAMQSAGSGAGLVLTFEARNERTLFNAETVMSGGVGSSLWWSVGVDEAEPAGF